MKIERHHFQTIDSTNTWGLRHANGFDPLALTVITAEEQTAGRGRFKRQWVSPAGENIYCTFCFFLDNHRLGLPNIPQVLAVSAAELLESEGFHPKLKWPNDILLNRKKVSGILCETTMVEDKVAVVVGIGLNVNMPLETLKTIDIPATSLHVEGKKNYSVETLLNRLIDQFHTDLELFLKEGFTPLFPRYQSRFVYQKGDEIRLNDFQKVISGQIDHLNPDGSLSLHLPNGEEWTCISGELL
jgi:BirA family biotin operon repressor/biotin-[acetyl-CoA-carboxylase] ligase